MFDHFLADLENEPCLNQDLKAGYSESLKVSELWDVAARLRRWLRGDIMFTFNKHLRYSPPGYMLLKLATYLDPRFKQNDRLRTEEWAE